MIDTDRPAFESYDKGTTQSLSLGALPRCRVAALPGRRGREELTTKNRGREKAVATRDGGREPCMWKTIRKAFSFFPAPHLLGLPRHDRQTTLPGARKGFKTRTRTPLKAHRRPENALRFCMLRFASSPPAPHPVQKHTYQSNRANDERAHRAGYGRGRACHLPGVADSCVFGF